MKTIRWILLASVLAGCGGQLVDFPNDGSAGGGGGGFGCAAGGSGQADPNGQLVDFPAEPDGGCPVLPTT